MSDALDLTGAWEGIFNYPRALPSGGFRAELREAAGAVDGETEERGEAGEALHAAIAGTRSGKAVAFTKTYDGAGDRPGGHPPCERSIVLYEGTLSSQGDEITGRWTIPGNWSGSFIMVRAARRAAPVARAVAETVR